MPIPDAEHAKYVEDVTGFLKEVGAMLENIQIPKYAGVRFVYEGGESPGAKKKAYGFGSEYDFGGEEMDKDGEWYAGAHVLLDIKPQDEKADEMDIGLVREIPKDLGIRVELKDEPYTLEDVSVYATVIEGEYRLTLKGKELAIDPPSSGRIDEKAVNFFEKMLIPAADKHGISIKGNFLGKLGYAKANMEKLKYEWAFDDFLGKINARRVSVEGSTGVLVHATGNNFEVAIDGKDVVWFDVNEDVNDMIYDDIAVRIDEAAKAFGFTFEKGYYAQPSQPQQQPTPMPCIESAEFALPSWFLEPPAAPPSAEAGPAEPAKLVKRVKRVVKKQ